MRYQFDSSKIDLSGGVKFTAKIKEKDLPEPPYIINEFDDAKVAYSLRKVSSDTVYSHLLPCIKVRQGGTSFLYDVGFTYEAGVLIIDKAQLLVIAKFGDLYVHTIYDQSGNGNHAVQTDEASQAKIVSAGSLIVDSNLGRPMMDSEGADVWYDIDTPFPTTQLMYQTHVFDRVSNDYTIGLGSSDYSPTSLRWSDGDNIQTFMSATMQTHANNTTSGLKFITVLRDISDNIKVWLGATPLTTQVAPNVVANFEYLGRRKSLVAVGGEEYTSFGFSELIYWNIDKESSKSTIDTLTNDFYGL